MLCFPSPPVPHPQVDLNKARQAAEAERAARQDAAAAVSLGRQGGRAAGCGLLQLAAGMHGGLLLRPRPRQGSAEPLQSRCQPSRRANRRVQPHSLQVAKLEGVIQGVRAEMIQAQEASNLVGANSGVPRV